MNNRNKKELLSLCTLSGTTEIGRNSNFVQYGDEIVMIDAGYAFPGNEMYGIDYIIPNTQYLKKNKHKIKAILITHGHLDHIGALKWILPDLDYPPIYAGGFAKALIEEKMKEYKMDKRVKVIGVDRRTRMPVGKNFKASFIGINHSIPDAFAIFLETPKGNLFFSGDFKIDKTPANEPESDYSKLKSLNGKVDLALMDSTNAAVPGKSPSETEIAKNLETIISGHNGRVIVSAFSSLITRLYSIIEIAKKTNRKIIVSGRSLEQTLSIARNKGYIRVDDRQIIKERDIKKYPANQILILCTGSQGERYAALNRMSLNEHKYIKLKKGDLVVMSSSEIPGNITKIGKMTDRLLSFGVDLVKDDGNTKIHTTGHANQEDIKMMIDMIHPKYIMPVHGSLTFRYFFKKVLEEWGWKEKYVLMAEDGQTWNYNGHFWNRGKKIPSKPILIDGLGVGDIGDIVLKDRKQLSEFGMFAVVINLSSKNKKIIGKPRFLSRGFVYLKSSHKLLKEIENTVFDVHRDWTQFSKKRKRFEEKAFVKKLERELNRLIYKKTEREPIILVAII